MSTGYQVLVMLHLLCVIGGFGAVAYNGLYVSLAQRRAGGAGSRAILEVNTLVSGLAELLIYAALVFGLGAVAMIILPRPNRDARGILAVVKHGRGV